MKEYVAHHFAELFPIINSSEMLELVNDIKARGLLRPITLYEGKILDGRHRYEACGIAEVTPRFEVYRGKDPLGFVLSSNLRRRHLNDSQRALVAAKLETFRHGDANRTKNAKTPMISQDANLHLGENGPKTRRIEIAEQLAVSPRSVATASKILDASPKLANQVATGELSLNAAEKKLEEKQAKNEPVLDETGWPVPEKLQELWARRGEVREMLATISNIENRLLKLQEDNDPLFAVVKFSSAVSRLQYAHMEVKAAQLYAVCPTCQGRNFANCKHCSGRGILSKLLWDLVPAEIRAIRAKGSKK